MSDNNEPSLSRPPIFFASSPTLLLAALQQQQRDTQSTIVLVPPPKEKKKKRSVSGCMISTIADRSGYRYEPLESFSTKSIMDELLRGGPVPTKLNNLRLKKDNSNNNAASAKSAGSSVASSSSNSSEPATTTCHNDLFSAAAAVAAAALHQQQQQLTTAASHNKNTKQQLLASGLLAATDEYPVQYLAGYRPDPITDVIVGETVVGDDATLSLRHNNVHFQHLCASSAPAFQAAIEMRNGEAVKTIVKAILQTVTDNGGHFVTLLVGNDDDDDDASLQWSEVCRNVAERFTLQELRKMSANQKKQAASAPLFGTDRTDTQQQELPIVHPAAPFLRRVSPPDLEFPSQTALEAQQSWSSSQGKEVMESARTDMRNAKLKRPNKQPRTSGIEALYLLSEAAAKVESLGEQR